MTLHITALTGIPEITPAADLAREIVKAARAVNGLHDEDIVVVTSKVVSKVEGRVVSCTSPEHREQIIDAESVRLVARRGQTRIVETAHGLILAAAGVDESNAEPHTLVLLPEDPDESARRLRRALQVKTGKRVGVIITDSLGRAWRVGIVEHAIGVAGITPVEDLRGSKDHNGRPLTRTVIGTADQLAAAAGAVVKKNARTPVVLIRGSDAVTLDDGPGAAALIRPADEDLFRTGSID